MNALNGENIGSTSKDLVLNTFSKIYIRYGNRFIEIDPIKLEKLLKSVIRNTNNWNIILMTITIF